MFERTLNPSWNERSRRGFTALSSFGAQILIVAMLLIIPLLRPQSLPSFHQLSTPVSWMQPPTESPAFRPRSGGNNVVPSSGPEIVWRQPAQIPRAVLPESAEAPPQLAGSGPLIPGPVIENTGAANGVMASLGSGLPILPSVPTPSAHHVRL